MDTEARPASRCRRLTASARLLWPIGALVARSASSTASQLHSRSIWPARSAAYGWNRSFRSTDPRALSDRLEITELTNRLGLLVDARDWDALTALFSDPVDVDYTSLNGGEPMTVPPASLVGGWRGVLDQLEATST